MEQPKIIRITPEAHKAAKVAAALASMDMADWVSQAIVKQARVAGGRSL